MDLRPFYALGFVFGATWAMVLLVHLGERLLTKRTLHSDLQAENPARRYLRVGQVLGVSILATSAVRACAREEGFALDLAWVAAFGALGLLVVAATWGIGVRLLLRAGVLTEIERGNQAAGIAGAAHWVATSLVVSQAIGGRGLRDLGLSVAFCAIALVALLALVSLFRWLTTYDDSEQIHGDNRAAALSYSGALIAIALLVGQAVNGDFLGWTPSLLGFARALATALLLYPVRQIVVQMLLLHQGFRLRGGALDRVISVERNEGIGALEAVAYLATALAVLRLQS